MLARGRFRGGAVDDAAGAPLTREGLGSHLAAARAAGLRLAELLGEDVLVEPELDIVCLLARRGNAEAAFDALAEEGWHVAKLRVGADWARQRHPWVEGDGTVTALRCCLMKPEHPGVVDRLAAAIAGAVR